MFTELAVNLLWEQYGKSFLNKIAGTVTTEWQKFNWSEAEQNYKQSLLDDYGKVKLFGKDDSVALSEIFTDVYIHSEISAMQRFNVDELHEEPEKHNRLERHNGFELLQEGKFLRWFILGKPGAGKTTFLKYITLQAVDGKIDKVPIFISLHAWANFLHKHDQKNFDLMPFLLEQFRICQFPEAKLFINYLLSNGKALLLFDGLDEVNQADNERSDMMFALREFSREYRKCTILLTCRVAAADYSFNEQFKYLEVADFTAKQIDEFVRKWFKNDPERAEYFLQEFNEPEKHKNLRDLGKVPILLSLLCVIYERKMEFPTQRADIYEEAIEALLETWDRKYRSIRRDEIYKDLSKRRKMQLFARIAAENFAKNLYFLKKSSLAEQISSFLSQLPNASQQEIDGGAVLEEIAAQHGIFVERAREIYSFAHLSFQEYFTARYIADNQAHSLAGLIPHITEDKWREVFLLTVGLLGNADEFFAQLQIHIDGLIADDEDLLRLFRWMDNKAKASKMPYSLATKRIIYYYFRFDLDRALDLARTLALDLTLTLVLALDLDRALYHTLGRARARARFDPARFDPALDLALARDLDLARDLALALDRDRALDLEIILQILRRFTKVFSVLSSNNEEFVTKYKDLFNRLIERAESGNMTALVRKLKTLQKKLPEWNSPKENWQKIAKTLEPLAEEYFYSGEEFPDLTNEQREKLYIHFSAQKLLIECLELANVTDREQIKDAVLRPPVAN